MTATWRSGRLALGTAAAVAVAVAYLPLPLREPGFVEAVSVVNGAEYDIHVEVSGDDRRWMSLATAEKSSTSVVRYVLDQGDTWVFRFAAQGRSGGELGLSRADLRRVGWVVEVPSEVVERLRTGGAPPTP